MFVLFLLLLCLCLSFLVLSVFSLFRSLTHSLTHSLALFVVVVVETGGAIKKDHKNKEPFLCCGESRFSRLIFWLGGVECWTILKNSRNWPIKITTQSRRFVEHLAWLLAWKVRFWVSRAVLFQKDGQTVGLFFVRRVGYGDHDTGSSRHKMHRLGQTVDVLFNGGTEIRNNGDGGTLVTGSKSQQGVVWTPSSSSFAG